MYPLRYEKLWYSREAHKRDCALHVLSYPVIHRIEKIYGKIRPHPANIKLGNLYYEIHWAVAENIEEDLHVVTKS